MAKKKTKAVEDTSPISSKELKFWLKGILEFQSDDWIPNAEQWDSIKNKIFNLEDVAARVTTREAPFRPLEGRPSMVDAPLRQEGDSNDGTYEDMIGEPLMDRRSFPSVQPVGADLFDEGGTPTGVTNFPRLPPSPRVNNPAGIQGDPSNSKATNDLSGNEYKSGFE